MASRKLSPTAKRTALLKRRLKYHGIEAATGTVEERREARKLLTKVKKEKARKRVNARFSGRIAAYNATIGSSGDGRDYFHISNKTIEEMSEKDIRKLSKTLLKITKRVDIVKNKKKLVKELKKAEHRKGRQPKKGPSTINTVSGGVENKYRNARGDMTILEELYFENFKKACLRKGAYSLYRKAVSKGYSWVLELYDKGFDINDLYEFYEEGISDVHHDDATIDAMLEGSKKIPKRDSEIGAAIRAKYRIK